MEVVRGDWAWVLEEVIDAGDDVVVAMVVMRAHGMGGGTPIEAARRLCLRGPRRHGGVRQQEVIRVVK